MRERILSSVLFPAPLRPMMPMTSPARTLNVTSRNAQKSPSGTPPAARTPRTRRHAVCTPPASASLIEPCRVG
jgi:hypothetical protein